MKKVGWKRVLEEAWKGFTVGLAVAVFIMFGFNLDERYELEEPITELPIIYELSQANFSNLATRLYAAPSFPTSEADFEDLRWKRRAIIQKLKAHGFSKSQLRAAKRYVDYIEQHQEAAMVDMRTSGVFASIKLAQALLESAAGSSKLAKSTHNHFGIKARTKNSGHIKIKSQQYHLLTNDDFYAVQPGVDVYRMTDDHQYDRFELYNSVSDSYARHSQLLTRNCTLGKVGCYAWIWQTFPVSSQFYEIDEAAQSFYGFSKIAPQDFFDGQTHLAYFAAAAAGLKMAGYATSKTYHKKIAYLIETYELYKFDLMVKHLEQ
ncbi:MAG: glucosaminidase domain-containing protein [Bacteroidota bacterium]